MPIVNNLKNPPANSTPVFNGSEWEVLPYNSGSSIAPGEDIPQVVSTTVGSPGVKDGYFSKEDHSHQINLGFDAPANVNKTPANQGSADAVSRSDHKHDIDTASAVSVGKVNLEGSASSLARSDHQHEVTNFNIAGQTLGDILYFDGTNWVRQGIGTIGQSLRVNDSLTAPIWLNPIPVDHDLTFGPVGLWQLHGNLVDTSGSGIGLTVNSLTQYCDLYPNYVCYDGLHGNGFHATVPSPAPLALTGDMTVELLIRIPDDIRGSSSRYILAYDANTGTAAGNRLWGFGYGSGGFPIWNQQSGIGVDSNYNLSQNIFPSGLFHLAITRTSNVVQFYVNGLPLGPASSALTTPTGGSSSTFQFGFGGGAPLAAQIASIKIVPNALTATNIKSEYNRTLGNLYGKLS